ncbi:MAG: ATP-binding cassette domain-containing protein [Chromatiales bacterium]|jgi:oligopeptide transport system ATP-binding protein|nr:ATP-binding cassette domain-containing protein [Chromatiales bacterium]MDH4030351.1 ATP-binding cassette domain-containing protein [Chromatiales bacterium]
MAMLEVDDLTVEFSTADGMLPAVRGVGFSLEQGDALGIVGESGSGKSQTVLALMGLLADNGRARGRARFDGQDLLSLSRTDMNNIRGEKISMIFQDPMTSLNPYLRVSRQMAEVLTLHKGMARKEARAEAIRMLDAVHIPDAASRIDRYPHEFSGGMRQRVMIAMSLLCRPRLIIADEPTTALDVTVQSQILMLLDEIRREFGTAVILITHDLGVVAEVCDRVLVMYGGRVMESGVLDDIFRRGRHPYTRGLLASVPRLDKSGGGRLQGIPGTPPSVRRPPPGCPFEARCTVREDRCAERPPPLQDAEVGHQVACYVEMET